MNMNTAMPYATYILANASNTVLYVGVTNNLQRRLMEHKSMSNPNCFTAKYNVNKLVYFEEFQSINDAIRREKQIKHWNRIWKNALICKTNIDWKDLSVEK